jgi:hypothetical protein
MRTKIISIFALITLVIGTPTLAFARGGSLSNTGFSRSNPPDLIEDSVQPLGRGDRDGVQEFRLKPFLPDDQAMPNFGPRLSD